MDNETEIADSPNGEDNSTETVAQEDTAALQSKLAEVEQTNRQLFERAKKAEGFVKVDGKWVKAPKAEEAVAAIQKAEAKAGELDETVLDFLDLKGITEDDDIAVIQKVMQRTGQTVRQALKDDYVAAKLKANQEQRAVQTAMPSGTKRSGGTQDGFEAALAKFDQTGELPQDFALRSKVINATVNKNNASLPPWQR